MSACSVKSKIIHKIWVIFFKKVGLTMVRSFSKDGVDLQKYCQFTVCQSSIMYVPLNCMFQFVTKTGDIVQLY